MSPSIPTSVSISFKSFSGAPILFLIKTPVLTTVQRFLAVMLAFVQVLNSPKLLTLPYFAVVPPLSPVGGKPSALLLSKADVFYKVNKEAQCVFLTVTSTLNDLNHFHASSQKHWHRFYLCLVWTDLPVGSRDSCMNKCNNSSDFDFSAAI